MILESRGLNWRGSAGDPPMGEGNATGDDEEGVMPDRQADYRRSPMARGIPGVPSGRGSYAFPGLRPGLFSGAPPGQN